MFTGIITHKGVFQSIEKRKEGLLMHIRLSTQMRGLKIGESIAVNGICLTLHRRRVNDLFFYLLDETYRLTSLFALQKGDRLNLERSLTLSSRLGGHLVTGHIDGMGVIKKIHRIPKKDEKEILIKPPTSLQRYIARKGSVAVDGISLTVGKVTKEGFWIYLVKYTLDHTNLGTILQGSKVNLEVDIIARYVENLFQLIKI